MSLTATQARFDQKRKENHAQKQREQQLDVGRQAYALNPRITNADLEISATADLSGIQSRIVNGTPTNAYPSVGMVGASGGFFCSGTLIAPRYVLTAAHCAIGVADTDGRFNVGGRTYSTSRVFVHPDYDDFTLDNDIAIYELSASVNNVIPSELFRGVPQVGQTLTLVGFGGGGTGDSGHTGDFGTKRVGTTPIDGVTSTLITWNFDDNTESNTAPGDSGGPAFLNVGGQLQLAGVTSGGRLPSAGIGDFSFDTRVDAFQSWIDNIAGTNTGGGGGGGGGGPTVTEDDHSDLTNSGATVVDLDRSNKAEVRGRLETRTDRDVFTVEFDRVGAVVVEAAATRALDTYLRVYDGTGKLVAQNDDFKNSTDARLRFTANSARYYFSVGAFEDRGTGAYKLSFLQGTARDQIGNAFGGALELNFGPEQNRYKLASEIDHGKDIDFFRFTATATGRAGMSARKKTGNVNTVLRVFNSEKKSIAVNNDGRNTKNANLNIHVKQGETYYIKLSSIGNSHGDYIFDVFQRGKGQPVPTIRDPNIALRLTPETASSGALAAGDLKPKLIQGSSSTSAAGNLFAGNA